MMEREYIQKLLDRYMAAETSKEEEQLLSDYFCTHRDIPAEWRNYSVMFRSIRQYKQRLYAPHRRTILKWSAAAAIIAFIFGTGWLFVRHDVTEKPSDAVAQIAEPPTTDAMEAKQEMIAEEAPVMVQPQTRQKKRKRRHHLIPAEEPTRSLSSHRDEMRKKIQATFEASNIFIAENSVEL